MKVKKIIAAALAVTSVIGLVACNNDEPLTDEPLTGGVLADFTQGEAETFFASHGWDNGDDGSFNVTWDKSCIAYKDGAAKLSIADAPEGGAKPYLGGELRTYQHFGYGDYTVRMKPLKEPGAVSTFFTYTGPSENDEDGNPNPWDEIDIEFIGKDTTVVQFNYFANGKGGNEYKYKLGFDASKEFHDYGFRWAEDYIVWFVDGKPVYKVKASAKKPIPSTPGRILMSHWSCNAKGENWAGKYKGPTGKTADYVNVKTSAQPIDELPAKVDLTVPETGWTDIDVSGFDGWGNYTVDNTDGVTISHDAQLDAWKCCGTPLAQSYSWIKMHVKNNETTPATMRIDVKDEKGTSNAAAGVVSEHSGVEYNINDKAVFVVLGANEEADIAIKIDGTLINQMVVFLNSVESLGALQASGSVTISGLQGVVNSEPVIPPVEEHPVKIGDNEVTFAGAGYTVSASEDKSTMTVDYEDIGGKNYNFISANISEFVGENNVYTVTIKNEGAETAKIRADIVCDKENGSVKTENGTITDTNDFCNISAEYTGTTVATGKDYDWGGADWVQIAAGETVTVKIAFTSNVATGIRFFIDSSTYDDEGTHTGKIVFSGMGLSKEEVTVTPPPPPVVETNAKIGDNEVTFGGAGYTVTPSEDKSAITVDYSGIGGADYNNISTGIAAFVADNNVYTVTIKNEGAETAKVRIDVNCDRENGSVGNEGKNDFCNISATYTGETVASGNDYVYGGGDWVQIAAGQTVTVKITFTANVATGIKFFIDSSTWGDSGKYTGKLVFSDMGLSKEEVVTPPAPAGEGVELTFTSTEDYVVDKTGEAAKQITVTYTDLAGGTYKNIAANAVTLASGNVTFGEFKFSDSTATDEE